MRNIFKWYHERTAIWVTLSAWTGGTAVFSPAALWPVYSLTSLPIGTQIQLVQIQWVDTYVFLHNNSEIWTLTITPGSWYNFDWVNVNSTPVSSTAITLQDWDAIYVSFRVAEVLLARNPTQWYEMVWDWVDSIWFRFQNVYTYDSSYQSHYYSWEIWISDTDYPMPPYNYLTPQPPELVTSSEVINAMRSYWWDNLYVPWNTTAQNIYSNSSWGWINLDDYDWTPYSDWVNMHFVNTLEWQIICQMFSYTNQWEASDWTPIPQITWVQIPWTYVYDNPYCFARWDVNSWSTSLSRDRLYYIPWDYYNNRGSYDFRAPVLGASQWYLPFFGSAPFEISTHMRADVTLWKMRVLNTTKTNYSEDL